MRERLTCAAVLAAAVALAPGVSGQSKPAAKPLPTMSGGNGTMYIGTYKGEVEIYDEATEKLIDKIVLKTGIPRSLTPSPDHTRFYAVNSRFETIEVIDIASRKTLDSFSLSSGNKHVRILSLQADPANKYVVVLTKTATKQSDRWEIGPPTILQVDLATHQVMRTIPWPKGDERESVNLRIGPDGRNFFIFGDEVTVLDAANLTEVESWPYGQLPESGQGQVSLGPSHDFYDTPGTFTGLFTMKDKLRARQLMGIGRVDLKARKLDFQPIGPAEPVFPFAKAPDGKRAYGLTQDIGNYEFWTFDLDKNRVTMRTKFDGRPRMGVRVSSNGKLLYVYVAGATVDMWDAATHKYLRTMHLGGDQTTELFVVPAATPATQTAAR